MRVREKERSLLHVVTGNVAITCSSYFMLGNRSPLHRINASTAFWGASQVLPPVDTTDVAQQLQHHCYTVYQLHRFQQVKLSLDQQ